jgi:EmrB/QacA subfamily drug resistance transporter
MQLEIPRRLLAEHNEASTVTGMRRIGLRYEYVVAIVFVTGLFMEILDTTIVNVALPTLAREFGVGTTDVEWVVVAYLLSLAVWIPASGWIGDRFGTKRTFLFAIAVFTVASALCGQANGLWELVLFRVLQGVGGGMMTPVGTAMLFRAFAPERRAKASTVLIIPTVMAPALGPVLGGLLVTQFSWRWVFYVNVPLGIAAFVFGLVALREHREPSAGPFDVAGFVLSAVGLAALLYALSEGPIEGWRSPEILIAGIGGLLAFALLTRIELRKPAPMLALRLLRDRMFRNANLASALSYSSFAAILFLMPLFLQELRGLSALESGLTTFPQAIGVLVSSQIAGRLYPFVGPRRLMVFGLVGAACTAFTFTQVDLGTDLWVIRGLMFTRGVFMAFAFIPLQAATYSTITSADTGRATAIFSTQRQVAAAFGVATAATVLTTAMTRQLAGVVPGSAAAIDAQVSSYHVVFLAASLLAFGAAAVALLIRDEDAAATMRTRSRRPVDALTEPTADPTSMVT